MSAFLLCSSACNALDLSPWPTLSHRIPIPPRSRTHGIPNGPIPLNGLLERHQVPPLFTAVFGLILAFVLLQVIIAPIAIFVLLLAEGVRRTNC